MFLIDSVADMTGKREATISYDEFDSPKAR